MARENGGEATDAPGCGGCHEEGVDEAAAGTEPTRRADWHRRDGEHFGLTSEARNGILNALSDVLGKLVGYLHSRSPLLGCDGRVHLSHAPPPSS